MLTGPLGKVPGLSGRGGQVLASPHAVSTSASKAMQGMSRYSISCSLGGAPFQGSDARSTRAPLLVLRSKHPDPHRERAAGRQAHRHAAPAPDQRHVPACPKAKVEI